MPLYNPAGGGGVGESVSEGELSLSDNTTNDASTTKHGFLKKLSNVATEVLDGQGAWRTIAAILGFTPASAADLAAKVGGSTGATDNAILRADGTGGATLQSSVVTIADTTGALVVPGSITSGDGSTDGDIYAREANNYKVLLKGSEGMRLASDRLIRWSDSSDVFGTIDAGLSRQAARVVEVNNGTAGQYATLLLRGSTFAQLPAAPITGMYATVTDSNTVTWGATIAGGGANVVLAFYNGANWTVAGK